MTHSLQHLESKLQQRENEVTFISHTTTLSTIRSDDCGTAESEELDGDANLVDLVYMYLSSKTYPEGCSENKKRIIRRKCKRFRVDQAGELQYKDMQSWGQKGLANRYNKM